VEQCSKSCTDHAQEEEGQAYVVRSSHGKPNKQITSHSSVHHGWEARPISCIACERTACLDRPLHWSR